jgi:hypothetical protein
MNRYHATTLALVGWYLMIPPKVIEDSARHMHVLGSFLSQWSILESFDTAKECETRVAETRKELLGMQITLEEARPLFAECIASDDPRLPRLNPK